MKHFGGLGEERTLNNLDVYRVRRDGVRHNVGLTIIEKFSNFDSTLKQNIF